MNGYVEKITTRSGHGAKGPWTAYNIVVGGDFYSCGFSAPACKEGDYVEFDIVQKGKFSNAENIRVTTPAAGAGAAVSSGAIPANKRDVSIQYQSSRKDAIQLLSVLIDKEAIKLPAKQADKYDACVAILDDLTAQLYWKLEKVIEDGGVEIDDAIPSPGDA